MRSILEKAIVALLNEQHDEANQLMHRFMVARARQIHESLRHGDDSVLDETWNEELSEEYFSEDDLDGLEMSDEADDLEDDAATDIEDEDADIDAADVDASDADADIDAADTLDGDISTAADVSPEALEDIRGELEDLMAKFEAALNGDDVSDDSIGGDDDAFSDEGDDLGDDDFAPSTEPSMDDMDAPMDDASDEPVEDEGEEAFHESEEEDEDFSDLAESIVSELEKVSVDLGTDGKEFGGKSIEQNRKSPLGGKKANAQDAAPIKIKSTNHTGFERETAPAVADINAKMTKKPRNVNAKADAGRTTVSKEGAKGALLNSDFASGK